MRNIKHVVKERKIAYHQAVSAWCLKMMPLKEGTETEIQANNNNTQVGLRSGNPGRRYRNDIPERTHLELPFNKRSLHELTPEERDVVWTEHTVANYLHNQRGYRKYKRYVKRIHPRFI